MSFQVFLVYTLTSRRNLSSQHLKPGHIRRPHQQLLNIRKQCLRDFPAKVLVPPRVVREKVDNSKVSGTGELDGVPDGGEGFSSD